MEVARCQNIIPEDEMSPEQKKLLEWTGKGFDNRTHIVDHKIGKLIRIQPYRMVVSKDEGTYYVRDGIRYTEQGHCLDAKKAEAKGDKKSS